MKLVSKVVPFACRNRTLAKGLRRQFASESLSAAGLKPKICHYRVLGVSPDSTQEQVKKAYQKIVKKNHPDLNPTPEAAELYQAASEAYKQLSTRSSRSAYDQAQGYKDADWGETDETINAAWSNQDNLLRVINSPKAAPTNSYTHVKMTEHLLEAEPEATLGKSKRINLYADAKQPLAQGQPTDEAEQPRVVLSADGTKQNPNQLYEYFKYKYIKNPEVRTADPEAQLAFTARTHNATRERLYETRGQYQAFMEGTRHTHFEKKSDEAQQPNTLLGALLDLRWFLGLGLALGGLYYWLLHPRLKKHRTQTVHVAHGEGYKNKLAPV